MGGGGVDRGLRSWQEAATSSKDASRWRQRCVPVTLRRYAVYPTIGLALLRRNLSAASGGVQYTHDALDGHSRAIILPGRLQSKVATIQRSTLWRTFMRMLMLGHLCLLRFEPVCV